jgi:predicted RecB family nuclease
MFTYPRRSISIRASSLQWWVKCSRRTWLDHNGNDDMREEIKPFVVFQYEQGQQHETIIQKSTMPNARPVTVLNWPHGVELTKDALARGVSFLQAYLEAEISFEDVSVPVRVYGKVDQLLHPREMAKMVPGRRGIKSLLQANPTPYIPVEIKHYGRITSGDELQLDCYNWLVEQTTGVRPPLSYFYLSKDKTNQPQIIEHKYDFSRFLTALHEMAVFIDRKESEPEVDLNIHCRKCHWFQVCIKIAEDELNVDLLPRVPWTTKKALRQAGIDKLDQFIQLTPERLRQFNGIKTTAEKLLAQAHALIQKKPVWWGHISSNHLQGGWMFDIETNPKSQELWGIGWCDPQGEIACIIVGQAEADLITDDGIKVHVSPSIASAWDHFAEIVLADSLPLYHWTPYDASRFKKEAVEAAQLHIGPRMTDLAKLVGQSVRLPIISESLKDVAPYIGFEWSGYTSFYEAWRDYQIWFHEQKLMHLQQALQYLCDDVRALSQVYQWWITHAGDDKPN